MFITAIFAVENKIQKYVDRNLSFTYFRPCS